MKKSILLTLVLLIFFPSVSVFSQKKMDLKNAVVVGLFDKKEDRFQMEILLAERLLDAGVKTTLSLNYLKEGIDVSALASDSVQQKIKVAGFDTFVLFSVRGYDKRFKPATERLPLADELALGHLFPVFREEVTNVTFEFKIYKGTKMVGYDAIKVSSPSKEGMLKRLNKALTKHIKSNW